MDSNKAALCGGLQQTGLGRAQGRRGVRGGGHRLGRLAPGQSAGREEEDARRAGLAASGPPCRPGPGARAVSHPTGTHTKLVSTLLHSLKALSKMQIAQVFSCNTSLSWSKHLGGEPPLPSPPLPQAPCEALTRPPHPRLPGTLASVPILSSCSPAPDARCAGRREPSPQGHRPSVPDGLTPAGTLPRVVSAVVETHV